MDAIEFKEDDTFIDLGSGNQNRFLLFSFVRKSCSSSTRYWGSPCQAWSARVGYAESCRMLS